MPSTGLAELDDIESYYDTVPRANATVEGFGGLTLFVSTGDFPYYARPTWGSSSVITPDDVRAVRVRQRELGVPEAFEWVHDLRPDLSATVSATGLVVVSLPLMVFRGGARVDPPPHVTLRIMGADDPEIPAVQAAIGVGFAVPGTEVGAAGDDERRAATSASGHDGIRQRISAGTAVLGGAFVQTGAIAGGSYSPRAEVAEITGVATLPAYRRRGIGAALTAALVAHATTQGTRTCFLSAGSDDVARVYRTAGFERVATACIAGAPTTE